MSGVIKVEDPTLDFTIEYAGSECTYHHPLVVEFDKAIRDWFDVVPVTKYKFLQMAVPTVYSHSFEHVDGRKWKNTLDFGDSVDFPKITFEFTDWWRAAEFLPWQTTFRELSIKMRNQMQVTLIRANSLKEW